MRNSLLLIIALSTLSGCASGLKQSSVFFADTSSYDVICEDLAAPRGINYFLDVKIESRALGSMQVKAKDGKRIRVNTEKCILERNARLKERPVNTSNLPYSKASCALGEVHFSDSDLQLVDEDKTLNYLRRADGKIWLLPKALCPLSEQAMDLGE